MSHFVSLSEEPLDPIFGLVSQFAENKNPEKISLLVGYYQNEQGKIPWLAAIKQAEEYVRPSQSYLPMRGDMRFVSALGRHIFSPDLYEQQKGRITAAQSLGGSGALYLVARLLASVGQTEIWVPSPTWSNHIKIFSANGVAVKRYPYMREGGGGIDFSKMLQAVEQLPTGAPILLHAVCHNPTGFDLSQEEWRALLEVVQKKNLLPVMDCAYHGFGDGVEKDRFSIGLFASCGIEMMVCYSCSKILSLYAERTGALYVLHGGDSQVLGSHLASLARATYSSPPSYGALLATEALEKAELYQMWLTELQTMQQSLFSRRQLVYTAIQEKRVEGHWESLLSSKGLFFYSGIPKPTIMRLRSHFGIFLPESGRINITGLNSSNISYFVQSLCSAS